MNLFGPHIHRAGMGLDLLERGQFAAALAMDVDSAYVREVRQRSPGTILVVRVYEDGHSFLDWSPEAWVGRLLAKFPTDRPDYFVTINEPFGHDSSELFERFDVWESEVIRLLQANGTDGLACNFGTGNFTGAADRVKIPDVFPRICAVANAMGPHDYDWPDLQHDWSWRGGRWFQWYDDILAATGREMKFLIGECGLTQAVIAGRPDWGWQSGGPEGVTAESYLATLRWYLKQVVNWDAGRGIVLGLCIFNWYDQFHWSFEHIDKPEVVDAIVEMDVPVPPPEPPNGGDPMEIKIYDYDGQLQNWDWLRAEFGDVQVHPVEERFPVREGERVYKVGYLRAKSGYAAILINTKDPDAQNVVGETVVFGWGTAEPHGLPNNGHNWTTNGVPGLTNETGDVGPGMGTGAYYSPVDGERGPHWCWVYGLPSDYVDGLGMLAMTNHNHVDVGYCEVVAGESEPPEPPPMDGDLLAEVKKIGVDVAAMRRIAEGGEPDPSPSPPPEPPPDTDFWGEYYNNTTLGGVPVMTRADEKIDFDWGSGGPGGGVGTDDFSVGWTATKTFEARPYTFHAMTDDGFRLWVDGELLIDAWALQPPTPYSATKVMTAGQHVIKVEYFERGGGATCKLWWE